MIGTPSVPGTGRWRECGTRRTPSRGAATSAARRLLAASEPPSTPVALHAGPRPRRPGADRCRRRRARRSTTTSRCGTPAWCDRGPPRERALLWVADRAAWASDHASWVVRDLDGHVIGAVSVHHVDDAHGTAEIGYWMAADGRERGIGAAAVDVATRYAFEKLGLARVELFHAVRTRRRAGSRCAAATCSRAPRASRSCTATACATTSTCTRASPRTPTPRCPPRADLSAGRLRCGVDRGRAHLAAGRAHPGAADHQPDDELGARQPGRVELLAQLGGLDLGGGPRTVTVMVPRDASTRVTSHPADFAHASAMGRRPPDQRLVVGDADAARGERDDDDDEHGGDGHQAPPAEVPHGMSGVLGLSRTR